MFCAAASCSGLANERLDHFLQTHHSPTNIISTWKKFHTCGEVLATALPDHLAARVAPTVLFSPLHQKP